MMKLYKKIVLVAFLLLSTTLTYAQYTSVDLETGKLNSAVARDAIGNIYTTRFQSAGFYEIVKYANGTGTPTVVYGFIPGDAYDLPYGLAVSANGDVYFSSEMSSVSEGKITRLNAANGYAATVVQTGRYFTGLAFDKNNKLYALEYTGSSYAVVRYDNPSASNSTKTTVYGSIVSGSDLSYPTSISVANDLTIYFNNVFSTDGAATQKGGIVKLATSNGGTSYTKTDLNTTNYTSAIFIDEFNNLYAIESVASAAYKLYKYTNGIGPAVEFYSATFASAYPFLAYGVTAFDNKVYAIDGDNGSNGSRLLRLTPNDITPPSMPTGLTASALGGARIVLNWTANNAAEGISGYKIYRGTTANPTVQVGSVSNSAVTFTDTGLANAQQYFYKISAVDTYFNEGAKTGDQTATTAKPVITSAAYDAATKILTVTGTNFLALAGVTNDIVANKLTITAEGATTRVLSAANVELTSATSFSVTLSTADQTALNTIINKNGLTSTGATTYNLAVATGWAAGEDVTVNTAQATVSLTVSNVAIPTITSATYNAGTAMFVVNGTNFLSRSGAANDIVVNKFTVTGEGGVTYTFVNPNNVEITSATAFTFTLNATDKVGVYYLLNKVGTASANNTTYNLAAADDWNGGADAAIDIKDLTTNGITVSNVDGVLPVVLASFTATKSERDITLNWSTRSELNSDVFVLSKSTDGVNFTEIDRVKAAGNSTKTLNYSSIDKNPYAGTAYYKLLQLDKDAKVGLEKILPVNFLLTADMVSLYPNPVVNDLNIKVSDSRFTKAALIDVNGKLLKSYQLNANGGVSTINLSMLAKGVYMLKLTGAGEQIIKKVIKN